MTLLHVYEIATGLLLQDEQYYEAALTPAYCIGAYSQATPDVTLFINYNHNLHFGSVNAQTGGSLSLVAFDEVQSTGLIVHQATYHKWVSQGAGIGYFAGATLSFGPTTFSSFRGIFMSLKTADSGFSLSTTSTISLGSKAISV